MNETTDMDNVALNSQPPQPRDKKVGGSAADFTLRKLVPKHPQRPHSVEKIAIQLLGSQQK
jgi:hypothetical protein